MTSPDKHDSPDEHPHDTSDDYASPEEASVASREPQIPSDWMLNKRRPDGREADPGFPGPAAASRIAASPGLAPSRLRPLANRRLSTTRASTVSPSTTRASTVSPRVVRTSTVRFTIAGTTRARAAGASTADNVAESPARVPQPRVSAKRQPAAPAAGEPSIAPQSHNRLAVPWALRVTPRSTAVPNVATQPIARRREHQSRPSPRLPAIVASRPLDVRAVTAKPTATKSLVIPTASVTSAQGITELFAAAATEPVSATTVSAWRRPVTLFTVATAAAVVVILGGTGLVASTRPVTLSAAPSAEPIDGSGGVIDDGGPDRAPGLPTLAQPELPLVAPIDPSLPPVAITNPNVGRGPLRPGAPAPQPSPFYAPMSFASSDAAPPSRTNPAPRPVTQPAGPAEAPIDPADPTDPAAPTDPVTPTDPVAPIDPVTPIGPLLPGDPVQPTDPVIPPLPIEPLAPIVPAVPSAPG